MLTAGVAVDKATLDFDRIFSYTVPYIFKDEIKTGSIVLVPFGRGDKLRIGIVLAVEDREDVAKLKSVVDVKNEDHTITPYALSLIKHLKETFEKGCERVQGVYEGSYDLSKKFPRSNTSVYRIDWEDGFNKRVVQYSERFKILRNLKQNEKGIRRRARKVV